MARQRVDKTEAVDNNTEGGSTIDKSPVVHEKDPWELPVFVYPAVPPGMDGGSSEEMVNKVK